MGYYIQMPKNTDKAQQLVDLHDAAILTKCPTFEEIPKGKALICVVDNGPFEAAALCHSAEEFAVFSAPDDVGPNTVEYHGGLAEIHIRSEQQRPRTWVLMDQSKAHELAGFTG